MDDPSGQAPPQPDEVTPDQLRGWITPILRRVLIAVTYPSDHFLGSRLSLQAKQVDLKETAARARRVDTLVAISLGTELICYLVIIFSPWYVQAIAALLLAWRVVDIIATAMRVSLFDRFEASGATKPVVASHARIVVLGLINYLEVLVSFGGIYATLHGSLKPPVNLPTEWLTPLYFSAITQFTIGYGDIAPTGAARAIVVVQGTASLLLVILIVGRFVSLLRPEKSLDESDGR